MAIYKAYYHAMYNTAFRIVNNAFEAEDIMQEAFLSGFTKIHTYKGDVTFGAWLKKIVINKSLTELKKKKRYEEVKLEVVREENSEPKEEINYNNLKTSFVLQKLNSLKDNYKIVLTLNLIEGYDYEEIAEILNYTNENVRTTVSRAKKKLKQLLIATTEEQKNYAR